MRTKLSVSKYITVRRSELRVSRRKKVRERRKSSGGGRDRREDEKEPRV